jgi:hypothetical protein
LLSPPPIPGERPSDIISAVSPAPAPPGLKSVALSWSHPLRSASQHHSIIASPCFATLPQRALALPHLSLSITQSTLFRRARQSTTPYRARSTHDYPAALPAPRPAQRRRLEAVLPPSDPLSHERAPRCQLHACCAPAGSLRTWPAPQPSHICSLRTLRPTATAPLCCEDGH